MLGLVLFGYVEGIRYFMGIFFMNMFIFWGGVNKNGICIIFFIFNICVNGLIMFIWIGIFVFFIFIF